MQEYVSLLSSAKSMAGNLGSAPAKIDHDEIMMQLKTKSTIKSVEARVNSNIDKFNELAKKFENY